MARVKRGVTTHARHKKVLAQSKGFVGRSSTNYRMAIERLEKALRYAYRDRRVKKREFRALWIQRINAATREHGLPYSRFIAGLKGAGIEMDRKVLSAIAYDDPTAFGEIVKRVQEVLATAPGGTAPVGHEAAAHDAPEHGAQEHEATVHEAPVHEAPGGEASPA